MKAHYESFKHKLPFSMNLISLGSAAMKKGNMKPDLTSDLPFTTISERKVTCHNTEVHMAKDTKERILMAALEMFSQKGYEGTNIRELSASLGLVKSGIYKHYESKEAIWNALLDRMIAYYGERFGSVEHLPPVPDSLEDFISMTMQMAQHLAYIVFLSRNMMLTNDARRH